MSIRNLIVEIRWSYDHLIFTMEFLILIGWHLFIESASRLIFLSDSSYSETARIVQHAHQEASFPAFYDTVIITSHNLIIMDLILHPID